MTQNSTKKIHVSPVQIIEYDNGIILKRGCTELQIIGKDIANVVQIVLTLLGKKPATLSEITELFEVPARPAIANLLEQLLNRRILVFTNDKQTDISSPESSLDIFYWHFDQRTEQVARKMNDQHIVIMGVNCISRQLASSLLASDISNFEIVDDQLLRNLRFFDNDGNLRDDQWPDPLNVPTCYEEWSDTFDSKSSGCLVATSDFGSRQLLQRWNKFCVEYDIHFLPVVLHDLIGYVGPLIVPGETACFECLCARQNSNLSKPHILLTAENSAFEGQKATGFHPAMASILGNIVAFELTKFYGQLPQWRVGTLLEVDLLASRMTPRKVLKIPRCPVCSHLNHQASIGLLASSFSDER